MPKMICKCGNVIGLSDIPSPDQLLIISDEDFGKFEGLVDAEKVYAEMNLVVLCPVCARLHVFWDGFGRAPVVYKKEI